MRVSTPFPSPKEHLTDLYPDSIFVSLTVKQLVQK